MRLLFDLEADGLLEEATKVHCIAAVDIETGERFDARPHMVPHMLKGLDDASELIGHNILRYDLPLLKKLYGWEPRPEVIIRDTLVMARLMYPNIREKDLEQGLPKDIIGRHNLEAWGHRLKQPKIAFEGPWDTWSQEMHTYMLQDVQTNLALWKALTKEPYSEQAIELEHKVAALCDRMETEGIPFDTEAASRLMVELVRKKEELEKALRSQFGRWQVELEHLIPKRDNKKLGYTKGVPVPKFKAVEFNPGSRDNIIKVLKDRGWQPKTFTPSGKPEINESILTQLPNQYPEMAGMADYMLVEKRLSQLSDGDQAWLKVVKTDGKIHGAINPMGTATSRASHFFPNLAQVPAVKSPYGKECRALFHAPNGWVLVGADMEGLELRCLAHYLAKYDGGSYAAQVLDGDVHWANAQAMGLASGPRDPEIKLHQIIREAGSKRFIYAFIYGCGNEKAGQIVLECLQDARKTGPEGEELYKQFRGSAVTIGKKVRNDFAAKVGGYGELKGAIGRILAKQDWLPGLDGRRIPIRSEHSALNYIVQSAGAILCKNWISNTYEDLVRNYAVGWQGDVVPVLWVHDEFQVAVREGLEKQVGAIMVKHAEQAGEPYGFRVRLNSKYKVGHAWSETH